LAKERGGTKYLAAYYSATQPVDEEELRTYLKGKLPEYMIPSAFVYLPKLPLTVNGKLDRKALPEPDIKEEEGYEAPANETEEKLRGIFGGVLGIDGEKISVTADFFRLGGDSIRSIQLASRIRREMKRAVSVKELFSLRTVRAIGSKLGREEAEVEKRREQGIVQGNAEKLPIQEWFFTRLESGELKVEGYYNQAFMVRTPELEIDLLKLSVTKLVEYHDAFRLRFRRNEDGTWEQYYQGEIGEPEIRTLDIRGKGAEEVQRIVSEWQSGFDIEAGLVYSIGYLEGYGDGSGRIHLAAHHLVIDGVSWRILAEDLERIYTELERQRKAGKGPVELERLRAEQILGAKGASYRQWAAWLKEYGKKIPEEERSYWENIRGELGAYNAGLRGKREPVRVRKEIALSGEESRILRGKANDVYGTEAQDLLISALVMALEEPAGTSKRYVTLEGHGREDIAKDIDITRTMGWFTSMYPVALETGGEDPRTTVIGVKDALRKIPEKGIGYGVLYGDEDLP
jgi:acyl carrier protein